jgi:hypothetical protein
MCALSAAEAARWANSANSTAFFLYRSSSLMGRHFSGKTMPNAGHAKSVHRPVGQTSPGSKNSIYILRCLKASRGNRGIGADGRDPVHLPE